jgi:hypothetical protein
MTRLSHHTTARLFPFGSSQMRKLASHHPILARYRQTTRFGTPPAQKNIFR